MWGSEDIRSDDTMLHLSAFVSERLSAAVVDICGEVEKTLSLYRVEVSRSREEICLLRQELAFLRDNSTGLHCPVDGTGTNHPYIPYLQEDGTGPPAIPASPRAPLEKPQESEEDHGVVPLEFLPGPSEKTEHDTWNSCMAQPNVETPRLKEEQGEFIITAEGGSTTGRVKSEPCDRDGAGMKREPCDRDGTGIEFTYMLSDDDEGSDEEWVMGDERQPSCNENQTVNTLYMAKGQSNVHEGVGVATTSPCDNSTSKNVCPVCGKAFHYASALVKHMKSHNNKCGVCGKSCASTKELLSHLKATHSKTHFCQICGRTFSKHCQMIVHARAHTDVREHTCDVCGKAFFRKDHLVVHVRTHSGEKPYGCNLCGKAFSQSQSLTIHRRSHTGEKPYQCSICGKLFITSSQRNSHMRNQHSDERLQHALMPLNSLGKADG